MWTAYEDLKMWCRTKKEDKVDTKKEINKKIEETYKKKKEKCEKMKEDNYNLDEWWSQYEGEPDIDSIVVDPKTGKLRVYRECGCEVFVENCVECEDDYGDIDLDEDEFNEKWEEQAGKAVIHPNHYNQGIEAWDYIISHNMNFLEGNIIKYITRYKHKNGLEDLKKVRQYLNKLIETEYGNGN